MGRLRSVIAAALLAVFAASGAFAQTSPPVPAHTVPIGLGPGHNGFNNTGTGTSGQVLTSNGSSADPTWQNGAGTGVTSVGLAAPSEFSVSGSPVTSTGTLTFVWANPVSVAHGGTGLASGTSGGIPYFSGSTSMASTAALLINQIMIGGGAGNPPATLGSLGTTTTVLHGNAAGAPSFGAVVSGDLNITPTTCTNQFLSALSASAAGTCTTDTLASAQHANQGTTTTVLHGNAAGNPSWTSVVSADLNITPTTCTNQFVTAISGTAVGTCTTDVLASAQHANQGTTTTVLHGNAAGNPSFAAVSLSADVTGSLALSSLASQAADTVVMNASGSSTAPTAVAMPTSGTNGCAGAANALTYNTTTHALGCNSISGSGTVTSIATTAPLAGGTITTTGTLSITGAAGQVLAGSGPAFTATPTLGVAGSTVGTLAFANATSGSITLSPPTGALGSVTLTLPDATDTLIGKATTDTLTNKTYDTAGTGNSFKINGTSITAVIGTGSTVKLTQGQDLAILLPSGDEPPASNNATWGLRNQHPFMDFTSGGSLAAIWTTVLSRSYSGNGLSIVVNYVTASATSGTAQFQMAVERDNSGASITSDNFATAQTATAATVPGTSGLVGQFTIPISSGANMGSAVAGDQVRFKLTRGTDTATGDLQVLSVEVREAP